MRIQLRSIRHNLLGERQSEIGTKFQSSASVGSFVVDVKTID
jgi:hypothetical protein